MLPRSLLGHTNLAAAICEGKAFVVHRGCNESFVAKTRPSASTSQHNRAPLVIEEDGHQSELGLKAMC